MSVQQREAVNNLPSGKNFKFPWICRSCTYINDIKLDECSLCKFANPEYDPNLSSEVLENAKKLMEESISKTEYPSFPSKINIK